MNKLETKRGKPEDGGYIVKVEEFVNGGAIINLPDELMKKMGWIEGDTIDINLTENLFEFGEVDSIILRNLTKEKANDESIFCHKMSCGNKVDIQFEFCDIHKDDVNET
jgi:hypothetical protein